MIKKLKNLEDWVLWLVVNLHNLGVFAPLPCTVYLVVPVHEVSTIKWIDLENEYEVMVYVAPRCKGPHIGLLRNTTTHKWFWSDDSPYGYLLDGSGIDQQQCFYFYLFK